MQRGNINNAYKLAKERGGFCLSTEYINALSNLVWKCNEGHEWPATYNSVNRGSWCKTCSAKRRGEEKKKYLLSDLQYNASLKKGYCLSTKYEGVDVKYQWQCSFGHFWYARFSQIKKGHWCPRCNGNQKYTIEEMRIVAEQHGGECKSDTYINSTTKLSWRCREGHEWDAIPSTIVKGHWCPTCAELYLLNQNKVKYIFEGLLGMKINKNRSVLDGYELDGYNKELNIAFEYNGEQHYHFIEYWHKTMDNFLSLQARDEWKGRRCAELGINLLVLNYRQSSNFFQLIIDFIANLNIPFQTDPDNFSWDDFNLTYSTFEQLKRIAMEHGGKLISESYSGSSVKHTWECSAKHRWDTIPENILAGKWCKKCADIRNAEKNRLTIDEMNELAQRRGGECLSEKYINAKSKLKWKCQLGHEWEAPPNHIKEGVWCPKCAGNAKLTLEDMQELAKNYGGECVSEKYINVDTRLEWKCSEGHNFKQTPYYVKIGRWCPECKNL